MEFHYTREHCCFTGRRFYVILPLASRLLSTSSSFYASLGGGYLRHLDQAGSKEDFTVKRLTCIPDEHSQIFIVL